MKNADLTQCLVNNFQWFEQSGVMDPADGSWGIAERIVVVSGNNAIEKTRREFPAHRDLGDYLVIEHRRPDCNFQAALAYLLFAHFHGDATKREVAEKLLEYLYCRSASRNTHSAAFPYGTWRWSDDRWIIPVWFDDNSWCTLIPRLIAGLDPELDRKFHLIESAEITAHELYHAMMISQDRFGNFSRADYLPLWNGFPDKPHFGSLACMAIAGAMCDNVRDDYRRLIESYHHFLEQHEHELNASEQSYALLGASIAAAAGCDTLKFAIRTARRLLATADPKTGNIPSENGREAPEGKHLVDLIYTLNWAALGFQSLNEIAPAPEFQNFTDRTAELLVKIQDRSDSSGVRGCWRGMFDLHTGTYGGGDCYEGGANSIYTGWTNAPIHCFLSMHQNRTSFAKLLKRRNDK